MAAVTLEERAKAEVLEHVKEGKSVSVPDLTKLLYKRGGGILAEVAAGWVSQLIHNDLLQVSVDQRGLASVSLTEKGKGIGK